MSELFRAMMKAHDNGQEFPVYVRDDAEAQEAAEKLSATVIDMQPASYEMQRIEMLQKMFGAAFGLPR